MTIETKTEDFAELIAATGCYLFNGEQFVTRLLVRSDRLNAVREQWREVDEAYREQWETEQAAARERVEEE